MGQSKMMVGVFFTFLAFTCIAFCFLISKFLPGVHVSVKTFFFFGIPVLASLPFLLKTPVLFRSNRYGMLIARSIFAVLSYGFTFLTITNMSLVDATLLQNTAPLWIPLIALAWTRERVSPKVLLCLLIGFAGIFLILNPLSGFRFTIWLGFGIASGILLALVLHALKIISKTEHPMTASFYYFLFAALMVLPIAIRYWQPLSLHEALLLIVAGLLYFTGLQFLTYGVKYISSALASSFCYLSVLWAAVFDWLIWRQTPTFETVIGIFLTVGSGVAIVLIEQHNLHPARHELPE